jgi:hypothetical protein
LNLDNLSVPKTKKKIVIEEESSPEKTVFVNNDPVVEKTSEHLNSFR